MESESYFKNQDNLEAEVQRNKNISLAKPIKHSHRHWTLE